MARIILAGVLIFLIIPFVALRLARPARTAVSQDLQPGISYQRFVNDEPDWVLHLVKVDLTTPGLSLVVTPADVDGRFPARTTSEFLREFDLDVAINGSFYQETNQPDFLEPLGVVIADGELANNGRSRWPALCVNASNQVTFAEAVCPPATEQALAGNVLLVQNGAPLNPRDGYFPGRSNAFWPQPRTAVALDAAGTTLWLVVVDGRQPGYSEGMTLADLAQFLATEGAHTALNFDGGGSSTLATAHWLGSRTLNSPVHTGIPTRQRPIPTHFGIVIQ